MDISEGEGSESMYALTPEGRLVYEEVSSVLDTFESIEDFPLDLEPFLEVVTKSEFEMEKETLCGLKDAEVYAATPTNLYGLFSEFDQFASQGNFVRGISWVSSELFVNQFYNYVVEQDKQVELILTPEVLQNLVESYTERWREILETGSMELFECDVYPFGLTVVEHGVAWGYFEPEKGSHEYELISESDAVQQWALGVFEEFKKRGRKVTDEELEKTKE
jgi:predicted transcriptional regulator